MGCRMNIYKQGCIFPKKMIFFTIPPPFFQNDIFHLSTVKIFTFPRFSTSSLNPWFFLIPQPINNSYFCPPAPGDLEFHLLGVSASLLAAPLQGIHLTLQPRFRLQPDKGKMKNIHPCIYMYVAEEDRISLIKLIHFQGTTEGLSLYSDR